MKRLRCIRAIRERFLILSSVAAGLQSAMQQIELRVKNVELSASPIKNYRIGFPFGRRTQFLNSKFEFQGTIPIKRESKDLSDRKATVKTYE